MPSSHVWTDPSKIPGSSCATNADCDGGVTGSGYCDPVGLVCVASCSSNSDGPVDWAGCNANQCTCRFAGDCPAGSTCVISNGSGLCKTGGTVVTCTTNAQCANVGCSNRAWDPGGINGVGAPSGVTFHKNPSIVAEGDWRVWVSAVDAGDKTLWNYPYDFAWGGWHHETSVTSNFGVDSSSW